MRENGLIMLATAGLATLGIAVGIAGIITIVMPDAPAVEVAPEPVRIEEEQVDKEATNTPAGLTDQKRIERMIEANKEKAREDAKKLLQSKGVEVPERVRAECESAGSTFNICPELLEAIAWHESRFTQSAMNGNCTGIMQVSSVYHTGRAASIGVSIYDEAGNIMTAASYLRELFDTYSDPYIVLKTYNGDQSNGKSEYAEGVLAVAEALERVDSK